MGHFSSIPWIVFAIALLSWVSQTAASKGDAVLVLGSGGLIGSALTKWLQTHGYEVHEVKNRKHIDLREPGALDRFSGKGIKFAFFLACEVGGSKFIDNPGKNVQLGIIEHNINMYQVVFDWLDREKIPFLFTSSYLQTQPNAYGSVKRLGESWVKGLGKGKVVRLWNIYGHERIGLRSHVLTDWVAQCLQNQRVQSLTNGLEARQFLHVDDCANALGTAMLEYDKIDFVTDISSNQWVTLQTVGNMIQRYAPQPCPVSYADETAAARARLAPVTENYFHQQWEPTISLEEGVQRLFREFQADIDAGATLIQESTTETA